MIWFHDKGVFAVTVTDDHRALFDLDPDAIRCPYPAFARLRDEEPVRFIEETGVYLVTRYRDVVSVVRDFETFSSRMPTGPHAVTELVRLLGELAAESEEMRELLEDTRMGGRIPVLLGAGRKVMAGCDTRVKLVERPSKLELPGHRLLTYDVVKAPA